VLDVAAAWQRHTRAARRWCDVTSTDYFRRCSSRPKSERLRGHIIRFQEADAENLPLPTLRSTSSCRRSEVMFTPNQERRLTS